MSHKKRVLIVTGVLAKNMVEKNVSENKNVEVEVLTLPIQVAAFISPTYAAKKLKEMGMKIKNFDLVLLPGMIAGDVAEVSRVIGIPVFKGPKHAADLPVVLDSLDVVHLSTKIPACELLKEKLKEKALKELELIRLEASKVREDKKLVLGSGERKVWTCFGYPPLLVAEIVNVPFLSDEEIQRLAKLYVKHGADVVDIGMVAGRKHPEDAERAVRSVFEAVKKPVSIDSNDVEEIKFAVEVGADLILSINGENMEEASKISSLTNKYVVVTPVDEAGKIPENYVERVNQLELNIKKARLLGFKHIIADPLLTVQNFVDSLMGYVEFRRRNPETPLLFGAGNITELVDVDSVGINFLLALLAWEVGVNLVFTTQASNKTQESVKELSTAIKMVALAKRRETPPKDLGIDLLILKEKKRKDEAFEEAMNEKWVKIVKAQTTEEYVSDPLGYFKVRLNRETEEILVFHYRYGKEKPDFVVKGKNPKDIYRRIFEENLISRLDHAAYLGSELQKARIALKTGKSYIQDNELFG